MDINNNYVLVVSAVAGAALAYYFYTASIAEAEKAKAVAKKMKEASQSTTAPRDFTKEELSKFDGSDANSPIYLSVRGIVYDVSAKRDFYGKGGSYGNFAGKDASRALGKGVTDLGECTDDLSDFTDAELNTLNDWAAFFESRYKVVGYLPASRAKKQ